MDTVEHALVLAKGNTVDSLDLPISVGPGSLAVVPNLSAPYDHRAILKNDARK